MRVLIAEDDATSRLMLQSLLVKWGYIVQIACDGIEAWEILNRPDHPQLVVLDWMMPGMQAPEIVQRLRATETVQPHYIIIVTSEESGRNAAQALASGADDYISKPFDQAELRARIAVGHRVTALQEVLVQQMRALEAANAEIARLAHTDELTGLPNRRSFNESSARKISATRRHRQPLSLIMADLDLFKWVNDTYGHDAGDRVLERFAALVSDAIRAEDLPARWGGEEFLILLPHTALDEAMVITERLRQAFASCRFEGFKQPVTASFGVAELQEGESREDLLQRVDAALYQAKHYGRNRVVAAEACFETTGDRQESV